MLYLHETIALGSAREEQFVEAFETHHRPVLTDLGARLFAIWAATPFNGHWPQATVIWELDSYAAFADLGRACSPGGSHAAAARRWRDFLAGVGASGEGRIAYPAAQNRPLARLRAEGFAAGLVIEEIMRTKPGRQRDYIRELQRLYVPWSERTGKRWLGSWITAFRSDEVIHYWALDGEWDTFAEHYPSFGPDPDPELVTWMPVAPALRDGWEDTILTALPPNPLR